LNGVPRLAAVVGENFMKRFLLVTCAALTLGGADGAFAITNTAKGAVAGAVAGAVVAGPVGAVVGGVGGAAIGHRYHHRYRHHRRRHHRH
jgi:hypothetical protein